jgi:type I restriction enzyme S subunit
MIEGWKEYEFSNCLVDNNVGRSNQINASEIKSTGKYPIIDQGQEFISGYTDEEKKLVSDGLPYIIFGDHTRCFKYVDFPFVVGADGTKVLSPNKELFDPKFFFFQLLSFYIPSRGYNRHYKLLKEKIVLSPPLPEQRKIAYVLSTVQKTIEQQDKLIKTTTELKKALMQKLFTEGTKGEKQKQTEIGPVPESWVVVELGDCLQNTSLIDPTKRPNEVFIYVDISSVSNELFKVIDANKLLGKEAPSRARKLIQTDDVIFATVRPTLKRIAKITEDLNNQVCSTGFCVLKPIKSKLNSEFLFQYLQMDDFIALIEKLQRGANYPAIRDIDLKRMKIPIPIYNEQVLIGNYLKTFDRKMLIAYEKKQTLSDLFKTLLQELMTGQRRVNEIDFKSNSEELLMAAEFEIIYKNGKE